MKRIRLFISGCFLGLSVDTASAATIDTAEARMDALMAQAGGIDIRFNPSETIVNSALLIINTDQGLGMLFGLGPEVSPTVNMFFVDAIDICGGVFDAAAVGCADQPGNNMVVENVDGDQAELNTHELGHNLGLPHINNQNNIMRPVDFGNTAFNADQINTILGSPLVQGPVDGRFIEITPILVTAVPLPTALVLLLSGIGVLGVAGRRGQALA